MYIYDRKPFHVAAAPHCNSRRRWCGMLWILFAADVVVVPHVHGHGLFIGRISLFTHDALSLRQCVSAWGFTLAQREKVENVWFGLTSSCTPADRQIQVSQRTLTHRLWGLDVLGIENFIVKGRTSKMKWWELGRWVRTEKRQQSDRDAGIFTHNRWQTTQNSEV